MTVTIILTMIMCALLFLMNNFGFNRKEQIRQCIMLPFAAILIAWICTLF